MENIIKNMLLNNDISYIIMLGAVLYTLYRLFLLWWDFRQKRHELQDEKDEYINNLIDARVLPITARLDKAITRIDNLDKLRLPTKLIAIETKLEILTSNVDAGFKRIEEDIRSFHRRS